MLQQNQIQTHVLEVYDLTQVQNVALLVTILEVVLEVYKLTQVQNRYKIVKVN